MKQFTTLQILPINLANFPKYYSCEMKNVHPCRSLPYHSPLEFICEMSHDKQCRLLIACLYGPIATLTLGNELNTLLTSLICTPTPKCVVSLNIFSSRHLLRQCCADLYK